MNNQQTLNVLHWERVLFQWKKEPSEEFERKKDRLISLVQWLVSFCTSHFSHSIRISSHNEIDFFFFLKFIEQTKFLLSVWLMQATLFISAQFRFIGHFIWTPLFSPIHCHTPILFVSRSRHNNKIHLHFCSKVSKWCNIAIRNRMIASLKRNLGKKINYR